MRLAALGPIGPADVHTEQAPGQGRGRPWCPAGQLGGSRAHANRDGVTTRSRSLMGFKVSWISRRACVACTGL